MAQQLEKLEIHWIILIPKKCYNRNVPTYTWRPPSSPAPSLGLNMSGQVSKTMPNGACDTNWSCVDINALFLSQIIWSSSLEQTSELSNTVQISQPHRELIIYREAMIPSWAFKSQIRIFILQRKRSVSQELRRRVRKYQGHGSCPTSSVSKAHITDPLNYATKPSVLNPFFRGRIDISFQTAA